MSKSNITNESAGKEFANAKKLSISKVFSKHKGFSVVELVIVIAIIAILSAVLIPTFSQLVKRANESKAKQEITNTMKEYALVNQNIDYDKIIIAYLEKSDDYTQFKLKYLFNYEERILVQKEYKTINFSSEYISIDGEIYREINQSGIDYPNYIKIYIVIEIDDNNSKIKLNSLYSFMDEIKAKEVLEVREIENIVEKKDSLIGCNFITSSKDSYLVNEMKKYLNDIGYNLFDASSSETIITDRYIIITRDDIYTIDIPNIIIISGNTYKLENKESPLSSGGESGFIYNCALHIEDETYQVDVKKLKTINKGTFDIRKLVLSAPIKTHSHYYDEVNYLSFIYDNQRYEILHNNQICINTTDYYSTRYDIINDFTFDEYREYIDIDTIEVTLIDGNYYEIGGLMPYSGTKFTFRKNYDLSKRDLLKYIDVPNEMGAAFYKEVNSNEGSLEEIFKENSSQSTLRLEESVEIRYLLEVINIGTNTNDYETVYLTSPNVLNQKPIDKTSLTLHNQTDFDLSKSYEFIYNWATLKEKFELMANPEEPISYASPYVKASDYFDEKLFENNFILLVLRSDGLLYTEYSNFIYTKSTGTMLSEKNAIILDPTISSICYSCDFVIIPKNELYQDIELSEVQEIRNSLDENEMLENVYYKNNDYYFISTSPMVDTDDVKPIISENIGETIFYHISSLNLKLYKSGENPEVFSVADIQEEEWFKEFFIDNNGYIACIYYSKHNAYRDWLETTK